MLAEEVHTQMPARVVSYNGHNNTCSIQPCINRIRTEDPNNLTIIELPQINDVPVKQCGSGKLLLSVAPQVDSYGVFYVCERDMELWKTNGGIVDPNSSRKFDLTDGWFDPGLYPLADDGDNGRILPALYTDRIGFRTRLGTSYIYLHDNGEIDLFADGTDSVNVRMQTNGTFTVSNTSGSIDLKPSGQIDVNGNFTVDA
jgi:hypothetical protein